MPVPPAPIPPNVSASDRPLETIDTPCSQELRPPEAHVTVASNGVSTVSVPAWDGLPWLWHGFSTRRGGISAVYAPQGLSAELNLGFTADDTRENVLQNRRLLAEAVTGAPGTPIVTLRQIHSAVVVVPDAGGQIPTACEGDGLMTAQPGILLGIQTADCVPVLVADRRRKAVAAFHAGWRGTVKRIVEHGIGRMRQEFGSEPGDLVAAIGPAIGACCYSVGLEVLSEFKSQFAYAAEIFHPLPGGSLHLDLFEANRRQLVDAGVAPDSISLVGGCTACQPQTFFSHRASHGRAGRMLSVVGVHPV